MNNYSEIPTGSTTKNDLGVDKTFYEQMVEYCNEHFLVLVEKDVWEDAEKALTTKNDLGVDCISREQALVAIRNLYPGMPRVDFNGSLRKWVDKYKPYIECDDAIKQLPSVTPQEPKEGHWITTRTLMHDGEFYCDRCKCEAPKNEKWDYCPNCGAKMQNEVEE